MICLGLKAGHFSLPKGLVSVSIPHLSPDQLKVFCLVLKNYIKAAIPS